jgi:hypothetical protein
MFKKAFSSKLFSFLASVLLIFSGAEDLRASDPQSPSVDYHHEPSQMKKDQGYIRFSGQAAKELYLRMTEAWHEKAKVDLRRLKPSEVSLDQYESRYGAHITCKKIPQKEKKKDAFKKTTSGELLMEHHCFILIKSVRDGLVF